MLATSSEQARRSVSLVDFHLGNEELVREEFLVPLFRASGYGSFGHFSIIRDVNLLTHISSVGDVTVLDSGRRHIYPDFVLFSHKLPLWIVDAKSPRVSVRKDKYEVQIRAYMNSMRCKYGMLSNALETLVFAADQHGEVSIESLSFEKTISDGWVYITNLLDPMASFARSHGLSEIVHLYDTGPYESRLFFMDAMRKCDPDDVVNMLLNDMDSLFESDRVRMRSLPANLAPSLFGKHRELFCEVIHRSCQDTDPIVRENAIMCSLPSAHLLDKNILEIVLNRREDTIFERFLTELYKMYTGDIGGRKSYLSDGFQRIVNATRHAGEPLEFPPALLIGKPRMWNDYIYYESIQSLPLFMEQLFMSDMADDRSIKMAIECVVYANKNSHHVFELLRANCTPLQISILNECIGN